jgi:hypothetical protein
VLERNPREIKRRRNFGGVFISTTASLVVLSEAKDYVTRAQHNATSMLHRSFAAKNAAQDDNP